MRLEEVFNPKNVAVIGATERENSVGMGLIENLKKGDRNIFYINHGVEEVFGEKTYSTINDLDVEIDLAIIAIPKKAVSGVVDQCIEARVKAVMIISAGFGETGPEGKKREEEIAKKLKKEKIPLVGPNCLGIIRPSVNLNASFAPDNPKEGSIALISQSGALIDSIIDGSKRENYGFSLIISVGNAAGLSLTDYIKIADEDENTKVITLYIEGIKKGREFLNALKEVNKPVVVIKGGKVKKSREAISSHTGSLAGQYEVFSAALRQAGVVEAKSLEELFNIAKALVWQPKLKTKRVGIITNGGGAGVLLTDYLYEEDFELPDLNKEVIENIEKDLHPDCSKSNPLDIVGDATSKDYELAIREVLKQSTIDGLIVILTLQIMTDPLETAKKIVKISKETQKTLFTVFMGSGKRIKKAVKFLEENNIPNYSDPQKVAKPLKALINKKDA